MLNDSNCMCCSSDICKLKFLLIPNPFFSHIPKTRGEKRKRKRKRNITLKYSDFPPEWRQVDDMTADLIISQLLFLDAEDSKKDIKLFINSPGGSITAGMFDLVLFPYAYHCCVSSYFMSIWANTDWW